MTTVEPPTLFPVDVLESIPGRSRRSDPETSKAAAKSVCSVKWGSQRARLLAAYASPKANLSHGLTDEEAGLYGGIRRVADTRRCSELRRAGLIKSTGTTRKTVTDCEAMVCRITTEGRRALLAAREAAK